MFVRYFWDVFNYSFSTGDAKLLESISTNACVFCSNSVKSVNELHARGLTAKGGQVSVNVVVAPPGDAKAGFLIYTVVSKAAGSVVDANGQVVNSSPSEPEKRSDVGVVYSGGQWLMDGVSFGGPPNG